VVADSWAPARHERHFRAHEAPTNRRVTEWIDATSEELLHLSVIADRRGRKGNRLLDDAEPNGPRSRAGSIATFACASRAGGCIRRRRGGAVGSTRGPGEEATADIADH